MVLPRINFRHRKFDNVEFFFCLFFLSVTKILSRKDLPRKSKKHKHKKLKKQKNKQHYNKKCTSLKCYKSSASKICGFSSYFHRSYDLASFLRCTVFASGNSLLILNSLLLFFNAVLFPILCRGTSTKIGLFSLLTVSFVLAIILKQGLHLFL